MFKSPQLHLYLCRSVTVFVLAVFGSDCFHRAFIARSQLSDGAAGLEPESLGRLEPKQWPGPGRP